MPFQESGDATVRLQSIGTRSPARQHDHIEILVPNLVQGRIGAQTHPSGSRNGTVFQGGDHHFDAAAAEDVDDAHRLQFFTTFGEGNENAGH